ncbi:hypothetical protein YC2023_042573 [Brassica napus]
MFRQGWDPGEQMVPGDKGRVDLHYYDGIGSEIGERKQKEGFSIKNLLDLLRHFRKFGKSRWSRQIESEKSLVLFRIGEFSSIFFQSLDFDVSCLLILNLALISLGEPSPTILYNSKVKKHDHRQTHQSSQQLASHNPHYPHPHVQIKDELLQLERNKGFSEVILPIVASKDHIFMYFS